MDHAWYPDRGAGIVCIFCGAGDHWTDQWGESGADPTLAGILVITLNAGAFISQLVRGALDSVDIGQKEAGASLGLSPMQIMIHIIIPPAFRSIIPSLFNQFIISVKDTALLSMISVNEITRQTQNYVMRTYKTIPGYTVCAIFYLVLLSVLMIVQKMVEKRIANK